ncbi:PREDICTED: uncharacterized protein C11orf35 homolog [Chrysochloris asiatica]|uniref:Uncharacterized protein C11orf35 homolog n=1 Tax=Chrysochloris asiatica TaxID=185453 RepID=A0A9B0UBM3_CHRAS|nr:PREDICTED: uncharacterized protein C11orf35 homolog [Chrysochloris asiatica]
MAPTSSQDTEEAEEEILLSPVNQEPVCGGLEPPTRSSLNPMASPGQQDTRPQAPQASFPIHLQAASESLDPHTLQLLWGQRELEIQALRWVVHGGRDARYNHILQEVAGFPAERSSWNQEKFLQNQVQKLTLELKEQQKQAQLEKEKLEQQLLQTIQTLQQLEAELETFQKSCLLQLACSSWLGRILRSQTGSVEVVTAETIMEPCDSSQTELVSISGEGFQLKDVDWNSVAQRYPNLLTEAALLEHKQPRPPPQLPKQPEHICGSASRLERVEGHTKSVEWSTLPLNSTSSEVINVNSRTSQLSTPSRVQKVTGHPPGESSHVSLQQTTAREKIGSSDTLCGPSGAVGTPCPPALPYVHRQAEPKREALSRLPRPSSRPILTDHSMWGLLCSDLLKTLSEEVKQPVPQPEARKDSRSSAQRSSRRLISSCLKIVAVNPREKFIRVLNQSLEQTADLGGLVLQQLEREFPVCLYRFPAGTLLAPQHHVTVWGEGFSNTKKHLPASLDGESTQFHLSRNRVTVLLNLDGEILSEFQTPRSRTPVSRVFSDNTDLSIDRVPLPEAPSDADTNVQQRQSRSLRKGRSPGLRAHRRKPRTRVFLPLLAPNKLLQPREEPKWPEDAKAPKPLPTIPEAGPGLHNSQARKEITVRVCRKDVDRSCPMVALSVQSTAESRYGFRFLSCPPITVDASRPRNPDEWKQIVPTQASLGSLCPYWLFPTIKGLF